MSFDEFWNRYPRKVAKGAARRAYPRALKLATHEEIMEGLERFISAEPWKGNKDFCPHASTWLNQERWEDEYEASNPVADMSYEERREFSRKLMASKGLRLVEK